MFVYSVNRISGFSRLDIKGTYRRKAHEFEITALGCTQGFGVAGVLGKSLEPTTREGLVGQLMGGDRRVFPGKKTQSGNGW